MYPQQVASSTQSDSPSSRRDPILDYVSTPRRMPDGMATVSRENDNDPGAGLRFTYRNGHSVHISLESLWDYVEGYLQWFKGDPIPDLIPSLALLVARDEFNAHGGEVFYGVSFLEWMEADYCPRTAKEVVRERRLRQFTADLPFAIYSEQQGWGIVVRPPSHLPYWDSEHRAWYTVWYKSGFECRSIIPHESITRFYTWEHLGSYIRMEWEGHLSQRQGYASSEDWRSDWKPVWRLVHQMWD